MSNSFRFPVEIMDSSGSQRIMGITVVRAADGLSLSEDDKSKLNRESSVFLTNLAFDVVPDVFLSTVPDPKTFQYIIKRRIDFRLNELVFDLMDINTVIKGVNTETFETFQRAWLDIMDKSFLLRSLFKTLTGQEVYKKLEAELRKIRCSPNNPEDFWTQSPDTKANIRDTLNELSNLASTATRDFCETWRSMVGPWDSDKHNELFRLDDENLTRQITRKLRLKNGRDKKQITMIYIILKRGPPILITFKNNIFGILDLSNVPHEWIFRKDSGGKDEIKNIFAEDKTIDSKFLTATMGLGVTLTTDK